MFGKINDELCKKSLYEIHFEKKQGGTLGNFLKTSRSTRKRKLSKKLKKLLQ